MQLEDQMYKLMEKYEEEMEEWRKNISDSNYNVLQEESWKIFIITLYALVIVIGFVKNLIVFTVIVKSKLDTKIGTANRGIIVWHNTEPNDQYAVTW
jgi:hypothetical protein